MSKFKTAIPVDVEAVKKLLPAGSFIHGVEWNKDTSSVELTWEHDKVVTPFSFAADLPLAVLKGDEGQPQYVKMLKGIKGPDQAPQAPQAPPAPVLAEPPAPAPTAQAEALTAAEQSRVEAAQAIEREQTLPQAVVPTTGEKEVEKPRRRR